jgi:hypothetical protein
VTTGTDDADRAELDFNVGRVQEAATVRARHRASRTVLVPAKANVVAGVAVGDLLSIW